MITAQSGTLLTATETSALQSGTEEQAQQYVQQLSARLPLLTDCLELYDGPTQKRLMSSCEGRSPLAVTPPTKLTVLVQPLFPKSNLTEAEAQEWRETLYLLFEVPVFNSNNQLRYVLRFRSILPLKEGIDQPKSLIGNTIVINSSGTFLANPNPNLVGQNIQQTHQGELRDRLESIVQNAITGKQDFIHLPASNHIQGQQSSQVTFWESVLKWLKLDNGEGELLAGYTAIASPTMLSTSTPDQWVILAVTPLDNALFGLKEIEQTLIQLILLLIGANLLASLYLAQDLARPVERLGEYALNVEGGSTTKPIPRNFKIREFNQLAKALNNMIHRLTAWAQELEMAWQEAKLANQLKSEFLANTSHELRTPLNAIIGCIRLVKDDCCDSPEEELEFLERADQAAVHLLQIINDVLDIAKIEAGTLSVSLEPVNVQQVVQEAIDLQVVHIQNKGLRFHWFNQNEGNNARDNLTLLLEIDAEGDIHPEGGSGAIAKSHFLVQADPAKLKQVLLNVISNAVKFTDIGGITLTTRIETEPPTQNSESSPLVSIPCIVIAVQDTGVGVEPSQQSKLFQPFVMVDGTRTRRFEGTGLGLAISRNLMELMHGSISLLSEGEGKGTTVEIRLPILHRPEVAPDNLKDQIPLSN